MNLNLVEKLLREKYRLPRHWRMTSSCLIGKYPNYIDSLRIVGTVVPLRGDGKPDYRKAVQSGKLSFTVTQRQYDEWVLTYELRTGKCAVCDSQGRVFQRWDRITGTHYRVCPRCEGTGHYLDRVQRKSLVLYVPQGFEEKEIKPYPAESISYEK